MDDCGDADGLEIRSGGQIRNSADLLKPGSILVKRLIKVDGNQINSDGLCEVPSIGFFPFLRHSLRPAALHLS
jgi:hypothetical protein